MLGGYKNSIQIFFFFEEVNFSADIEDKGHGVAVQSGFNGLHWTLVTKKQPYQSKLAESEVLREATMD